MSLIFLLGGTTMTKKVMIVDDSYTARKIMVSAFKGLDINITEADTSVEALEILEKDPNFQMIFTDINMPEQNGFKFIKKIRANETLEDLPVCVFTSMVDEDTIREIKKLGVEAFFPKPVQKEQVRIIAEKILTN